MAVNARCSDVDLGRVGSLMGGLWGRPSGGLKRVLFSSDGCKSVGLEECDGEAVRLRAVETRSELREVGSWCDGDGPSEIIGESKVN
jgi:hypothetical protein